MSNKTLRDLIDIAPAYRPSLGHHLVVVPSFKDPEATPYTVETTKRMAISCSCFDFYHRRRGLRREDPARRCKHMKLVEGPALRWWLKTDTLHKAGWSVDELRTLWTLTRKTHGVEAGCRIWTEKDFGTHGAAARLRRTA